MFQFLKIIIIINYLITFFEVLNYSADFIPQLITGQN